MTNAAHPIRTANQKLFHRFFAGLDRGASTRVRIPLIVIAAMPLALLLLQLGLYLPADLVEGGDPLESMLSPLKLLAANLSTRPDGAACRAVRAGAVAQHLQLIAALRPASPGNYFPGSVVLVP